MKGKAARQPRIEGRFRLLRRLMPRAAIAVCSHLLLLLALRWRLRLRLLFLLQRDIGRQ